MEPEDFITEPTTETILGRLDEFRTSVDAQFQSIDARFEKSEKDEREFRVDVQDRFDSIEKQVVVIRKDQVDMRMDLRELVAQLREHLPALK